MNIFYSAKFKAISRKACDYNDCWEDCHQDAIILIYEKGWDLLKVNNLEAFFYVCVWQIYKNWTRNRNNLNNELKHDIIDDNTNSFDYESLIKIIESPKDIDDWYLKNLLKAYATHGTYQEVSEKTGIPLGTVYRDIKIIRERLKKIIV